MYNNFSVFNDIPLRIDREETFGQLGYPQEEFFLSEGIEKRAISRGNNR